MLASEIYGNDIFKLSKDEKHVYFAWAILFSPIWAPILVWGGILFLILYVVLWICIYPIGVGVWNYLSELGGACYRVYLYPSTSTRPLSSEIEAPIEFPTEDIDLDTEKSVLSISPTYPVAIATIV
jgi:hypothetical protein